MLQFSQREVSLYKSRFNTRCNLARKSDKIWLKVVLHIRQKKYMSDLILKTAVAVGFVILLEIQRIDILYSAKRTVRFCLVEQLYGDSLPNKGRIAATYMQAM